MEIFEYVPLSDDQISEAKAEARAKFRRLTWYMTKGASAPNICFATERSLIVRARGGSATAARELAESHFKFLAAIATRVSKESNCEHLAEDLFSTAMDAFFRAVGRFDLNSDFRLNSFARYLIVGECRGYALANGEAVARGKGSDERKAYFNRRKIAAAFRKEHGRAPSSSRDDLALLTKICGIPPKALARGMFAQTRALPTHHIEIVSKDPSVENHIQRSQSEDALNSAFEVLRKEAGPRNYAITNALREEDDVSMVDLGKRHGITPERAGQIVRQSAKILRRELARRGIESRADLS
jgi:RNA polymerase sigma factor (sigma-70 family)